jgi:hypothetical protein
LGAALLASGNAFAAGKVGEMATEFANLTGLDNKSYSLKDYKGKVVLIMTVQWNCGGCNANAPTVGAIAMKFQGKPFQAFGPDINFASRNNLGTFDKNLKAKAPDVNFPLLMGLTRTEIKDSLDNKGGFLGTLWMPYNALRDVFFVIDHTGKIAARIEGNRANTMGADKYKALEDSIAAALSRVPSTTLLVSNKNGLSLRASKNPGGFRFDLDPRNASFAGEVALRILDPQGRVIRTLDWNGMRASDAGARQADWDGLDARGQAVPWGSYYLNATAPGSSMTLLLPWVP